MADIERNEKRYVVSDGDFQEYLSRVCAGEDTAQADAAPAAAKWFDYLEAPEELQWDGRLEANVPEFPGVTFRWCPEKLEAVTDDGIVTLFSGMPVWNAYFCDITGDGLPELCSSLSWGSGIVDNRVVVCDYANGASYSLEERGSFDYTLRMGSDGLLYVDKREHDGGGLVSTGRLVFEGGCVQTAPVGTGTAEAERQRAVGKYPE